MSCHVELLEAIERDFGARLLTPPQLTQDALTLMLDNGVVLTVRYAAADAYSLRWQGDAGVELGIDTAPTHPDLATRPNHLHLADGRVVADPLTSPDADPARNVAAVIEALLRDPQLSEWLA
ncbi:hypothetical protein [Accumulibacter sp.]|uniref:hypothetical protein n=1 Tax=Accumulibacter sp. TaxID=2053492 RepID=UPI001A525C70|nr:hypothetical protein [Accumulibacter sp.]MBL8375476.1 hypothetical protein [Accumulibacter sp.]